MARIFGKVGANLDRSERFWRLPDDTCRLAYTWLLWCRHGTPSGIFEMPPEVIGRDLRCGAERGEEILTALAEVGLIDRGPHEILRIRRWWLEQNAPRHPTAATLALGALQSKALPACAAVTAGRVEFAWATIHAAAGWDRSTDKWRALQDGLHRMLTREALTHPEWLDAALADLPADGGAAPVWRRFLAGVQAEAAERLRPAERERERERGRQ